MEKCFLHSKHLSNNGPFINCSFSGKLMKSIWYCIKIATSLVAKLIFSFFPKCWIML